MKIQFPAKESQTRTRKGLDQSDWQAKYVAPGSETNPGRFWKLPPLATVLDDLKYCGGRTSDFVATITEDFSLQQLLMMEIHEELSKDENAEHATRFKAIITFGKKAQLGFGIDEALSDFRETGEMNPTLLSKLGAQAMPDTFGTSAQTKDAENKAADDEQSKKVEDHIADLE